MTNLSYTKQSDFFGEMNPSELLPVAGIGILVGVFMIFVSRPLSVMLSMLRQLLKVMNISGRKGLVY